MQRCFVGLIRYKTIVHRARDYCGVQLHTIESDVVSLLVDRFGATAATVVTALPSLTLSKKEEMSAVVASYSNIQVTSALHVSRNNRFFLHYPIVPGNENDSARIVCIFASRQCPARTEETVRGDTRVAPKLFRFALSVDRIYAYCPCA